MPSGMMLRRELYGQRSERTARLLDQMELELDELEASATEGGRIDALFDIERPINGISDEERLEIR